MKLLYVTPRYHPYIGGVESHVEQVSRRLAQAGFAVHVLTTDLSGELPPYEERQGVCIQRVRAYPHNRDYYFAPQIYPAIRAGDWDLVHVQSYHTFVAPLAMLAALRSHIPYVLTFHGGGHSSSLRNASRGAQIALLRPLLQRADRLVAIARFEIDHLSRALRIPAVKFAFIPNGADLPAVGQAPAKNGTLIASVGRLERYKGHQRILAALPAILERKPDARLWIAGAGPYEGELRQMASRLHVAERVEIRAIPASDRDGMANALASASLMVLLSEYETHPIAVLEALSLDVPALVADTSGLHEIAAQGWARAVPVDSAPDQVAAAAIEQLEHPIKPEDLTLPTWDDCAASLGRLYREIIKEKTSCAS